ncbi:hypothetical protein [Ruegeria sediminis]|uniref:hypothetical protein n=1 Tax=Ruegeria sediminis TaxID=2583820 RepID=UPI001486FE31|nr:hypothetical protein [Ruegeria sediminis]
MAQKQRIMRNRICLLCGFTAIPSVPVRRFRGTLVELKAGENCYLVKPGRAGYLWCGKN